MNANRRRDFINVTFRYGSFLLPSVTADFYRFTLRQFAVVGGLEKQRPILPFHLMPTVDYMHATVSAENRCDD
jgi:hypothetical protein